jgi:hypothetical protein
MNAQALVVLVPVGYILGASALLGKALAALGAHCKAARRFGENVEEVTHVGLCWLVSVLIDLGA